jgi:hypothetical protein
MDISEIGQTEAQGKYLGLPVHMGRSKANMFVYLKDRVWKRIQGWKEKLLSRTGKEVSIKAVAQAIHSYAMSFLTSQRLYVMRSARWFVGFGGHNWRKRINYTGYNGKHCVCEMKREVLDIEIYTSSILRCWHARHGDCCRIQILSVQNFW